MEPPLKQPATSSAKQTSSLDDLPDDIIHKIFNFFTIKDIARFSTLSKRCRKLSITIPNLIESWLHQAAICNVEELELWVRFEENGRVFSLPLCFTEYSSFKYLNIELFNGTLKLPSVGFKFLQVVTLSDTRVQQHEFEIWLSNCESLQRLNICNIKGLQSLNIDKASLYYLEILLICDNYASTLSSINISACRLGYLSLHWLSYESRMKLTISAPNLETLVLDGHIDYDYYHTSSFNSLQKVSICSRTDPARLLHKAQTSTDIQPYDQIFQSVCHAKILLLNSSFVKFLTQEMLPTTSLQNVYSLQMHVSFHLEQYDFQRIASLLISFPNLEVLSWRSYFKSEAPSANVPTNSIDASANAMEFLLSKCPIVIDKLKLVEIDLDRDSSVLGLIGYMLQHAKELDKMTIYYSPQEHRNMSEIIRIIEGFRRASSPAVLVLPRVVPLADAKRIFYINGS